MVRRTVVKSSVHRKSRESNHDPVHVSATEGLCPLTSFLMFHTAAALPQQTGNVRGTVIDAVTGHPIAGAQATVAEGGTGWFESFGQPVWTNDEGTFEFEAVPVGPCPSGRTEAS